jgi:gluconolactonase
MRTEERRVKVIHRLKNWRHAPRGAVVIRVSEPTAVPTLPSRLIDPGAVVTRLAGGGTWVEGPLWIPETDSVRWSDIPGNRILEYSLADRRAGVYRTEVEFTNGRTLDRDGGVIQCSHGHRRLEKEIAGRIEVLADRYAGVRLNSPNDVVVANDGSVWFTDPTYGITSPGEGHPGEREYDGCFVFRLNRDNGELTPVITDMEQPNGLAFSPDETVLYVSDTADSALVGDRHYIRAYDVADGVCANGRVFATSEAGVSDGFRVDLEGNIWTSSQTGVLVYSPDGMLLGSIPVPELVSNLCFGGREGTDLFITATTSLYHVATRARDAAAR